MLFSVQTVVVDTSVWIDYFNNKITAHTNALDDLLQTSSIAVTDVILMEVLQGFRLDKDYQLAKLKLSALPCYEIMNQNNAVNYADLYRKLRKKGITIRKSNDVMIAGYCIQQGLPLLSDDKDFVPFVEHFGLLPIKVLH